MGQWHVFGTNVNFAVDDRRQIASGVASHELRPDLDRVDLTSIRKLGATWEMHRSRDALQSVRDIVRLTLLVYEGKFGASRAEIVRKTYDEKTIKVVESGDAAVSMVSHHESGIGFGFYLPDHQFNAIWELLKMIACGAKMSYRFSIGFEGFMPRLIPEYPEYMSYEEWLAGREHVAAGLTFRMTPVTPDSVD